MVTGRTRTPSSRRRSRPARHDAEDSQEEQLDGGDAQYYEEPKSATDRPQLGKRKRCLVDSKVAVRDTEPFLFFNRLLLDLISKPVCSDFLKPVMEMWEPHQVPNYLLRVKHPMDLGTVKEKLRADRYVIREGRRYCFDPEACAKDIRLIFENCMLYNDPDSGLHALAEELLNSVDQQISTWHNQVRREEESASKRVKKDSERRRRKQAEENAASAAADAARTALALEKMKKQAEEAERKRREEVQEKVIEMQQMRQRMEREREVAVQVALQKEQMKRVRVDKESKRNEAGQVQRARESGRDARLMNTSSVSSDEQEGGNGEVTFAFVSTIGMEKKRGRKSAVVMDLEAKHDELMKQRKAMVEVNVELEKMKQVEMTFDEKRAMCEEVAGLDFVRMKAVADIISHGMNRPDILNEVEIDLDVNSIDNKVLREIQYFLKSPVASTAKDALRNIEAEVADIESKLVSIRYQKIGG